MPAVRAALDRACHHDMVGKTIVVIAPSSGVRYVQHPMFKEIRDEAFSALAEAETAAVRSTEKNEERPSAPSARHLHQHCSDSDGGSSCRRRLDLVHRVESCILALVDLRSASRARARTTESERVRRRDLRIASGSRTTHR